jgi:hypothetical protein
MELDKLTNAQLRELREQAAELLEKRGEKEVQCLTARLKQAGFTIEAKRPTNSGGTLCLFATKEPISINCDIAVLRKEENYYTGYCNGTNVVGGRDFEQVLSSLEQFGRANHYAEIKQLCDYNKWTYKEGKEGELTISFPHGGEHLKLSLHTAKKWRAQYDSGANHGWNIPITQWPTLLPNPIKLVTIVHVRTSPVNDRHHPDGWLSSLEENKSRRALGVHLSKITSGKVPKGAQTQLLCKSGTSDKCYFTLDADYNSGIILRGSAVEAFDCNHGTIIGEKELRGTPIQFPENYRIRLENALRQQVARLFG